MATLLLDPEVRTEKRDRQWVAISKKMPLIAYGLTEAEARQKANDMVVAMMGSFKNDHVKRRAYLDKRGVIYRVDSKLGVPINGLP
jgi:hypothetical protein